MTKKNSTLIVVVLDRSGSMASVKEATVEGFNKFLWDQKQIPGEAKMTLVQFDDLYELDYDMAPLDKIHLEYEPRGSTALLYAMGRTIETVGKHLTERSERNRPDKVVFVTITDGHENYSHVLVPNYTRERIFEMVRHQREKYSWEFLFLGANQDAIAVGASMGVLATHSMSYDPSRVGTRAVYGTMGQSIGSFRSGEEKTSGISNEQREAYNVATGTTTAQPVPDKK